MFLVLLQNTMEMPALILQGKKNDSQRILNSYQVQCLGGKKSSNKICFCLAEQTVLVGRERLKQDRLQNRQGRCPGLDKNIFKDGEKKEFSLQPSLNILIKKMFKVRKKNSLLQFNQKVNSGPIQFGCTGHIFSIKFLFLSLSLSVSLSIVGSLLVIKLLTMPYIGRMLVMEFFNLPYYGRIYL